jgi:hypothetical protein
MLDKFPVGRKKNTPPLPNKQINKQNKTAKLMIELANRLGKNYVRRRNLFLT